MKLNTSLNSSYEKLVNPFIQFLCAELKIFPREISVVAENTDDCVGMCIDVDEDSFLILVKEENRNLGQIFTTIAHEMIHVKQYMTQELGRLLNEESYIPYEERWWEKEAFENAVPLVEKFAKIITK
jgi:hypothetical protein